MKKLHHIYHLQKKAEQREREKPESPIAAVYFGGDIKANRVFVSMNFI